MKRKMQKTIAWVLCALLFIAALPATASAENYSGTCGENLQWSLNDIRGKLVISGTGAMDDFDKSPWFNHRMQITGVRIADGVTYIGKNAFYNLHCKSIVLPDSVRSIGATAIYNCPNLESVTFSDGMRSIAASNLFGCDALRTVHIPRFVQSIASSFMSDCADSAAVICSTTADCEAARFAEEQGIRFNVCTHTEHTHQYDSFTTLPTCTESGYTTYTCTVCEDSYRTDETDPIGHDWQETSRTGAGCETDGEILYTCSHDETHTRTQAIPATGHSYTAVVTAPTCTQEGYTTHTCSSCGDSYTDTQVPALGHHFSDGVCTVCGQGQFFDFVVQNGDVTITGLLEETETIEIPAYLNGFPVTEIAENAFSGCDTVSFVSIPDTVRAVRINAFSGCEALKEVYLGSSVAVIETGAFSGCPSLSLVCVTAPNLSVHSDVFDGCDARMMLIAPANSNTIRTAQNTRLRVSAYTYPYDRNGEKALAFSGETVLYGDLEYTYWVRLVQKYPDVVSLRFERLVFDGVSPNLLGDAYSDTYVDRSAESLTLQGVYVSVQVQGEQITFAHLVELLEKGDVSLAISFDSEQNERMTIFRAIGGFAKKVLHALAKLLNSIIRIFKRK